jgi:hypothetical protein
MTNGIVRIGCESKANRRVVSLDVDTQELRETSGRSDNEREHAAGHGIERAGVADAALAKNAAHARDHVM